MRLLIAMPVIEDGAQSFGSEQQAGVVAASTIGTTGFPFKPFGVMAMVVHASPMTLSWLIECAGCHAMARPAIPTDIGVNGRIDTLQAAILLGNATLPGS